jgi:hypothetical protein
LWTPPRAASSVVFAFDDVVEEHVRGAERDDGLNQERVEARHVYVVVEVEIMHRHGFGGAVVDHQRWLERVHYLGKVFDVGSVAETGFGGM